MVPTFGRKTAKTTQMAKMTALTPMTLRSLKTTSIEQSNDSIVDNIPGESVIAGKVENLGSENVHDEWKNCDHLKEKKDTCGK
jgi:hypothetical protein